jgi:hypothetical protein
MTLALDYNGTTDVVAATITSVSGACTFGAWVYGDSAGENNAGRIMDDGGIVFTINNTGAPNVNAYQASRSTTNTVTTDNAFVASTWQCVIARHPGGSDDIEIVIGDLDTPMALSGTTANAAGTMIRGTALKIGNRNAGDRAFDGRIARAFMVPWQMTTPECEAFRLGRVGVLYAHGTPRIFYPYASAIDLSGSGANGTITGAVAAEGPPIPMRWTA